MEIKAPTWHALYTSPTKSMPYLKTLPSAHLMGDNSRYNRPEQIEEMEAQLKRCNKLQPKMSQRLVLHCLFKTKGAVIFIYPCSSTVGKKKSFRNVILFSGHIYSDVNNVRKKYSCFSTYNKERFTPTLTIMIYMYIYISF